MERLLSTLLLVFASLAAFGESAATTEAVAASEGPPWLNRKDGPRLRYVWENREDVIYHDLSYADKAVESAPEFAAFMGRRWVFNRAMQWHREGDAIVCYSAPATLPLTGTNAVSAWHSDSANTIEADGDWTVFAKRSTLRRRDCAVLPAFQFHLGQNPVCELEVAEAGDDWQFVVSVKGRGGPPLLASEWKSGPGRVRFDLAAALARKGFDLHYAELHFVIGTWSKSAEAPSRIRFRLVLPGQPAVVASLPVVVTQNRAQAEGVPIVAAVLDAFGKPVDASAVRVEARVNGRYVTLINPSIRRASLLTSPDLIQEDGARRESRPPEKNQRPQDQDGLWRATLGDLPVGNHVVTLTTEGAVRAATTLHVRVTSGDFWQLDKAQHLFAHRGRVAGPLSGSYQGNVFVKNAGTRKEVLVQGQKAWNAWDRSREPGEHLVYWEGLTADEMDQRFAHLARCGWDLLHVCQHWGIWERLDAGGRIAPHGAEQVALYLRTAGRHGLAAIQALTHYEYLTATRDWHGTVPFTAYFDAGFETDDFFKPGRNPKFETMFHRYLQDYVSLFRDETALFAMTASGEGDATIGHARAHDVFDYVRAHDTNHLFLGEPVLILRRTPRTYTQDWRQDMFGGRTYVIGEDFVPEHDLGVEFKLYQLGGLALAEGSWGTSGLYADFHRDVLGDGSWKNGSWTGTERYRLRLRDTLYLGLVHRLPTLMTWDEQIAEDEHRLVRDIREQVDWTQPFAAPRLAVRLASDDLDKEHRRTLVQYQEALSRMGLNYQIIYPDAPVPAGVDVVFDAAKPFAPPAHRADGGSIPDELKAAIPLEVSPGYLASYTVSQDRSTMLAYLCNNGGQLELPSPLAGRFHRQPKAAALELRLQDLAARPLRLRLYDLNRKKLVREIPWKAGTTCTIRETTADYFLLVTP